MKKILVTLKRVPDYESKLKIDSDGRSIDTSGVKWVVNPFDEIAVEQAVRIKESDPEAQITVVAIGPEQATEQLRTALAIGADQAILVLTNSEVDSDLASRLLAEVSKREDYSIIIMGKQGVDSDANQTGQLLAARLDIAQATFASKLELSEDWANATVTCEVDGGLQTVRIALPAVVTTDLRLNEPRYPSLPNIIKAKKKPIETIPAEDLGVELSTKIKIKQLVLPPKRQAGIKVASVNELVDKLLNEAKVI